MFKITGMASPFFWREASLAVPAMPLILFAGMACGHPLLGAVAAGAAFSVGFGSARDFRGQRWGAMLWATLGMVVATFAGSLAGGVFPVLLVLACLSAAVCAALALYDEDLWWTWLQLVIALLVAGYYPSAWQIAADRAAAVMFGGLVQMGLVVLLARLLPAARNKLPPSPPPAPPTHRLLVSHTARAAVCVALTLLIARGLGLANSYWAPMTAIIVLKPGLYDTQLRGLYRIGGTVAGCVAATAFAEIFDALPGMIVAGIAVTAGLSFALQKAHYATLTCAITATVVLLLSLARGTALVNAEHRLIATLLGGLTAMAIAYVAPHRPLAGHKPDDAIGA